MAKKKRINIGSVYKGIDGKPDYIKVSDNFTLTKGQYINLENEKTQLADIQRLVNEGKFDEAYAQKRVQQTQEFWSKLIGAEGYEKKPLREVVRFSMSVTVESND